MKARPRSVERKVAEQLSKWFVTHGLSEVERIPVLGRTGPDISLNEAKLAIDVKSRLQVPKLYRISDVGIRKYANLIGVRLKDLDLLLTDDEPVERHPGSMTVAVWFNHNANWDRMPGGAIPALVLHWPGMKVESAVLLIKATDRRRLQRVMRVTT